MGARIAVFLTTLVRKVAVWGWKVQLFLPAWSGEVHFGPGKCSFAYQPGKGRCSFGLKVAFFLTGLVRRDAVSGGEVRFS
ncbi:hypothetical protein BIFGAL_03484 [Bifidobacterium gallicum DSM 20093 = LMG 11596]|uniref:Uncharacterized protein n=1 Tax=Bifidobacterium gallicum DSM 20093 = LMG 11596 TaxID=561180 RepID=D1NUG1_9BIFI|nr:hypothetical protein BIFGAL_03484 [Bifidobacterium gallicum DSM 20093 = LMG 11596]